MSQEDLNCMVDMLFEKFIKKLCTDPEIAGILIEALRDRPPMLEIIGENLAESVVIDHQEIARRLSESKVFRDMVQTLLREDEDFRDEVSRYLFSEVLDLDQLVSTQEFKALSTRVDALEAGQGPTEVHDPVQLVSTQEFDTLCARMDALEAQQVEPDIDEEVVIRPSFWQSEHRPPGIVIGLFAIVLSIIGFFGWKSVSGSAEDPMNCQERVASYVSLASLEDGLQESVLAKACKSE